MASKGLWLAYARILLVETTYWIVSISMVFVNEFVLGSDLLTDDLTVFITIFQILFSLGILVTLNYISKCHWSTSGLVQTNTYHPLKTKEPTEGLYTDNHNSTEDIDEDTDDFENLTTANHEFKTECQQDQQSSSSDSLMQLIYVDIPSRIDIRTCKAVFPLSVMFIGMLLLNNFCLKNVGVAFYFVSRSLTTVFNVIFTYFLIHEPVSRNALICCGLIILGFFLGIDQENVIGSLSVTGVIYGVASSLFGSLFSIYTKKTLAKLDSNIWTLVFYNHINAIVLCLPLLIIHGDIPALIADKVVSPSFWSMLSISGVMSFMISIVTNASIKFTSPLTHNISGTAKACFQTVIAVIYNESRKSFLWWLSNILILLASAAYSRIRQLEMEKKLRAPMQPDRLLDGWERLSSTRSPVSAKLDNKQPAEALSSPPDKTQSAQISDARESKLQWLTDLPR